MINVFASHFFWTVRGSEEVRYKYVRFNIFAQHQPELELQIITNLLRVFYSFISEIDEQLPINFRNLSYFVQKTAE